MIRRITVDILRETYRTLWKLNFVDNQCDFSEAWLNKSRRYYSMIRATGRKPSVDTLGRLAANVTQRHEICRNSHHEFIREKADRLTPLVEAVWREFNRRALERQPIPKSGRRQRRVRV
jgi:hypothetical protein